jgi:hypothetical protein
VVTSKCDVKSGHFPGGGRGLELFAFSGSDIWTASDAIYTPEAIGASAHYGSHPRSKLLTQRKRTSAAVWIEPETARLAQATLAARGEGTIGRAPRYCGQDQGARRRSNAGTLLTTSNADICSNTGAPKGFRRRRGICCVARASPAGLGPAAKCNLYLLTGPYMGILCARTINLLGAGPTK